MRFELVKKTGHTSFATRSVAAETRVAIAEAFLHEQEDRVLEVDLFGVEALTVSFADELVVKLAAERRAYGRQDMFLLISNGSPEVAETIEVALERRGLFVVHQSDSGKPELLAAPEHLKQTFEVALQLGRFNARQLADQMGLKPPAANNRIKALADAGALVRAREAPARGGRLYSYEVAAAA